jgi:hypothetical protein
LDFYFFCSTQFPNTISKASNLCSAKVLSQEDSKFADPVFRGCKKSPFLHFKRYNLAIYVVNFFEKNSTHYFNSPKQDPTVESQKKIKIFFMQFALEVAILECSFINHNNLGVKCKINILINHLPHNSTR